MSTFNIVQARKTRLELPINASETTITLAGFYDLYGNALTMADFGDIGYGTIEPGSSENQEIISFSGITNNGDGTFTLTGVVRGLKGKYPFNTGGTPNAHGNNVIFVISNNPQVYEKFLNKDNGGVVGGLVTFTIAPKSSIDPASGDDLVRLSYLQAAILGTLTTINVIVPGKAGETVAAGNLVYFDETDNEWKKSDADTSATVDNVLLGIAQGAGTNGNPITDGVLIQGVDDNQSGLSEGDVQYASNTAGGISTSPGTNEVTVGIAKSATELYFNPRFNQVLTENLQDALGGTSGNPSNSNKFVTDADTAAAATAGKLARRGASGEVTVPAVPSADTDAASKTYVDGKSSTLSIPLGESFTGATTPQAAYIVNDLFQPIRRGSTALGRTSLDNLGLAKLGLKFTPRSNVTAASVIAMVGKIGAPSDNIRIVIQADSAGSPSGSAITNGTSNNVAGSGLSTTSKAYQTFTFSSPFTLTAGTSYWVVFERTSSRSDTDYYVIETNKVTNGDYASFDGKYEDGSGNSWVTGVLPFVKIIPSSGSGSCSLWQSDADATGNMNKQFHGFVTTTGSAGATGSITFAGLVSGFSGLLPYTDYYVSTTKGAVSVTNAGIYVGQAQSATTLFVPNRKRGVWLDFGTWSSNTTDTLLGLIEMPYDGVFTLFNSTDGTAVSNAIIKIMDDSAGTNPVSYYLDETVNGQRTTISIPVRKGQFIELNARSTGALEMVLIPEFSF